MRMKVKNFKLCQEKATTWDDKANTSTALNEDGAKQARKSRAW